MDQSEEELLNKLIVLFVFDKMDISLDEKTIINICYTQNGWMMPLYCMDAIQKLVKANFIHQQSRGKEKLYTMTPDGRICLANFYSRIPESLRQEISDYVKENRMSFKRQQEYRHTYYKNNDGTYTVWLRIVQPSSTLMDLKFVVANNKTAKSIHENWEKKAADIYLLLHDQLIE
ncbi:MAG: DUF4364 family protein [Clostridiales bacterium]|nr:DUF4364 family protein [Clostridiales bacterium]MCH5350490.1 DUF4364 family protein [Clostridiales bacterium]